MLRFTAGREMSDQAVFEALLIDTADFVSAARIFSSLHLPTRQSFGAFVEYFQQELLGQLPG